MKFVANESLIAGCGKPWSPLVSAKAFGSTANDQKREFETFESKALETFRSNRSPSSFAILTKREKCF